ncbi:hypothetical protein AVEN_110169-1 [Araneus ventricosus]|uniref:Uncharacterized protein n=1 Tax=Araneus ventricosus TaxID=182803 RepID=A0A4Y2KWR1_ARAVE|nr:hypothetical protein AVEN_110169-1 [Araneus ventricosus]
MDNIPFDFIQHNSMLHEEPESLPEEQLSAAEENNNVGISDMCEEMRFSEENVVLQDSATGTEFMQFDEVSLIMERDKHGIKVLKNSIIAVYIQEELVVDYFLTGLEISYDSGTGYHFHHRLHPLHLHPHHNPPHHLRHLPHQNHHRQDSLL